MNWSWIGVAMLLTGLPSQCEETNRQEIGKVSNHGWAMSLW